MDINDLTNSELRIKMVQLENEYESTKVKISTLLQRMAELDAEYIEVRDLLNKRTNGR